MTKNLAASEMCQIFTVSFSISNKGLKYEH